MLKFLYFFDICFGIYRNFRVSSVRFWDIPKFSCFFGISTRRTEFYPLSQPVEKFFMDEEPRMGWVSMVFWGGRFLSFILLITLPKIHHSFIKIQLIFFFNSHI